MPNTTYQHVGFHFYVSFSGLGKDTIDARFQSVSGLEVRLETENLKEGGENRFDHVLPTKTKAADLVLKRGVLSPNSASLITAWCIDTFQNLVVSPQNLTVILLGESQNPLLTWEIIHAWPKSWKFGELNAEKSEVLIETLELNYNRLEFSEP